MEASGELGKSHSGTAKGRKHSGKKLAPLNPDPPKRFTKKDLVEACRKQAPAFDQSALILRRKMRLNNVTPGVRAEDPDVGSQVKVMDNGVKTNAKKFNEYKLIADRLTTEWQAKCDELADLKKDEEALDQMINCTNPESKRIQELLVDIEKCNAKTEKKLQYRLQLNHMYSRLQRNSVSLDAHINAMEDTHAASEKELLHCENLMREIEAGRTKAIRDYEASQAAVQIERNDRARIISSKKNEAVNASKMEKWRNDTEKSRQELAQSLKGDLNQEEEAKLVKTLFEKEKEVLQWKAEFEQTQLVVNKLERAFREIKDATGVNSLREMVNKFSNHQEHRDRLAMEKKDAEDRLTAGKKALDKARQEFDNVKEVGFGDTDFNRDIRDKKMEEIMQEKMESKVVRATCERLEKVLVGLRQGGMGLYQRLLAYHPTLCEGGELPQLNKSATTSAIEAAYDTLKMLTLTETVLGKMIDHIGGGEGSPSRFSVLPNEDENSMEDDGTIGTSNAEEESIEDNPNLGPANIRIVRKVGGGDEDEGPCEGDEERGDNFDDLSIDDSEAVENMVPSRTFLKMSSGRQAGEARRQAEAELKRARYQEKLDAADEKERLMLTSTTALQKQQALANSRLAKHHHPVGLPKSLTVRDDPMTKAQVFMTEMPHLD
ncbi:hypothetical protein TrVE_jg13683 [Triparma verrucosa]|uniref:Uncharacterized protein n=1 Tax=Triparma verrucosa TaxID=1606542 RepID=A0A9W7BXT6_9STRA|nr:hypothetical protein TrVE_jg13683 [Triparma verrucosa]